MLCSIYKSRKKEGAYLYLPRKDDFSEVPDQLREIFGAPELVMVIKLDKHNLALADKQKVIDSIKQEGYFLQLPPPPVNLLEEYKQSKLKD